MASTEHISATVFSYYANLTVYHGSGAALSNYTLNNENIMVLHPAWQPCFINMCRQCLVCVGWEGG